MADVGVVVAKADDLEKTAPSEPELHSIEDGIVREGCAVVFRKDRIIKPCIVARGKKVKLDRSSVFMDEVLGCPFGSVFEVKKNRLRLVEDQSIGAVAAAVDSTGSSGQPQPVESTGVDNRELQDRSAEAQQLSYQEIVKMKNSGMSGQDIVESVVENSVSFNKKTDFSKKKYIDRKKKTHIQLVTVSKPSTRLLCEMYYARSPNKILYMRTDTIARMLTALNARSNSRLIAVETAQGLLISSLLERLGGLGSLVHLFPGDKPVRMALDLSGHIQDKFRTVLMDFPLNRVNQLLLDFSAKNSDVVAMETVCNDDCASENQTLPDRELPSSDQISNHPSVTSNSRNPIPDAISGVSNTVSSAQDPVPDLQSRNESRNVKDAGFELIPSAPGQNGDREEVEEEAERDARENEQSSGEDEAGSDEGEPQAKKKKVNKEGISFEERLLRRTAREEGFAKVRDELMKGGFDGLVVATRFHPEAIVLPLLPLLAPSRPFVIYSASIEPLASLYGKLKETGRVFDLNLSETWLRKYQVLPSRTHPLNQMNGNSGYILTGITVAKQH